MKLDGRAKAVMRKWQNDILEQDYTKASLKQSGPFSIKAGHTVISSNTHTAVISSAVERSPNAKRRNTYHNTYN